MSGPLRIVDPSLVVLVGPSGAGKSTWAEAQFGAGRVVSSDRLRSLVGEGEHDQRASADAFAVLFEVVGRRLARGLTTVVDTLGTDPDTRDRLREAARRHGVPLVAVVFDEAPAVCRRRNRERSRRVPDAVLDAQLAAWPADLEQLATEHFDLVTTPGQVRLVPAAFADADGAAARQWAEPLPMSFGLHLGAHAWAGGPAGTAATLRRIASDAEEAGFTGIWVMDHLRQIPQNGPEWADLLESWTTLAFLAAVTTRVRLGTLVTGITYRNVAHLGKIVATLDVLSEGRAVCGLGAAWFEKEHLAYGYPFPSARVRLDLLEDALQLLPMLWGKGAPSFQGKAISVPEALCYPRPLQEHVPLLVGGMGERRTLALAARFADACNLTGDVERVRRKVEVLRAHMIAAGRPIEQVEVTHLSTALVADDGEALVRKVEGLKPTRMPMARFESRNRPGTVEDHVGHFRELAEAGVTTAMVSLPDVDDPLSIETFAKVIAAFR